MTFEEYFGDWAEVVDKEETMKVLRKLQPIKDRICPDWSLIFHAFKECSFKDCKVVMLGQDPYPQPGVATGIVFGNKRETPKSEISPSLKVLMLSLDVGDDFDISLESWARQGVLMINSALTCQENLIGSHVELWKPFMSKLISNISKKRPDIVFFLLGSQAQYFWLDIKENPVVREKHPAYFARMAQPIPKEGFDKVNEFLIEEGKQPIKFV